MVGRFSLSGCRRSPRNLFRPPQSAPRPHTLGANWRSHSATIGSCSDVAHDEINNHYNDNHCNPGSILVTVNNNEFDHRAYDRDERSAEYDSAGPDLKLEVAIPYVRRQTDQEIAAHPSLHSQNWRFDVALAAGSQ